MGTHTRRLIVGIGIFAAGIFGGWLIDEFRETAPVEAPALAPPPVPEGENGLSATDRQAFYHLSEGGEIFPVDWLLALETETVAADGTRQVRPFLDNVERYGFLSDPKSAGNPDGLPVGISLGISKAEHIDMIGLNCTACHVGQVQYQGHAVRVDGLGNMALINNFLQDMATETEHTLGSPRRLVRFWERVHTIRAERRARGREAGVTTPDEGKIRRVLGMLTNNRDLVKARLDALKTVASLVRFLDISTKEGYGRLDAFGIGRDELFGSVKANSMPANAPVSFPHIWGMEYTGWLQWGANTNSVMDRNIGQALGVGALFDPKSFDSTVNVRNLHKLEQFAYKLTPPSWPTTFPAIDAARAAKGKTLFVDHCAPCHETYKTDGEMRTYQLFSVTQTGTDPAAALDFEIPVKNLTGTVQPFPYAARDLITQIKQRAYAEGHYDAATIDVLEHRQVRSGAQWDPTFRAPLLDSAVYPDTVGRKVYRAKTLVGIWATGPYLHNGSVPTIYDLLSPAASRPLTFPLGTREYDPVKLGVQTDAAKYKLAPNQIEFTFDTRLAGNWNTGHEWSFYPLDDDSKFAIIEFLKTFTSDEQIGITHPEPPKPANAAAIAAIEATLLGPDGPPGPLPPLSPRARLILFGAFGLFALGLAFLTYGVMPHGETARETEAQDTATLTRNILTLQQRYAAQQNRPLGRGTHTKGICCRAEFEVFPVDGRLAQGLFVKPGKYSAIVRFANAASTINSDRNKDVRACSFSVDVPPGVFGPYTSRFDFSMNNAPTFPINDVHAFAVTTNVVVASSMVKGMWKLPFRDKLGFLRTAVLGAFQERPGKTAYQLMQYWSNVPFHHGPADVAKYSLTPCPGNYAAPIGKGINCLQDELVRHLTDDAQISCFDFHVQLLEADTMRYWFRRRTAAFWTENASVEWKPSQAPFHTVARLSLVRNSILPPDAAAAMWIDTTANSAPDCRPAGGINRARPVAEEASRKARLESLIVHPSSTNR